MIQIIKGTYGRKRLTAQSEPVELSKEEEARLVKLGVAKYVDAPKAEKADGKKAAK